METIPIAGLDRVRAHPCRCCRKAKLMIDSHNAGWIWCTRLCISVTDRTEPCRHPDLGSYSILGRDCRFVSASREDAQQYALQQATLQTLSVLRKQADSWIGVWRVREWTGLDYGIINEALKALLAKGRVETRITPAGVLYHLIPGRGE